MDGSSLITDVITGGVDTVYASSGASVYISTDNGETWSSLGGPATGVIEGIAVSRTNIFAATDGSGLYEYSLGLSNWSSISPLAGNVHAVAASGDDVYVGYDDGTIWYSTDGGSSWNEEPYAPYSTGSKINQFVIIGSTVFAATDGGIYSSTDDGTTPWSSPLPFGKFYGPAYDQPNNILYAGRANNGIWEGSDGGTGTWTQITTGFSLQNAYDIAYQPKTSSVPASLIVGSSDGFGGTDVYFSANAGISWTNSNLIVDEIVGIVSNGTNVIADNNNLSPRIGAVGYLPLTDFSLPVQATGFEAASVEDGVLLTWSTKSEVDNAGFDILREDPGSSSFSMIASYATDDSFEGMGTSASGRRYHFLDGKVQAGKTYRYAIQSVSTGGKTSDLSTMTVTVKVPHDFALDQNYPNPFNPTTDIEYRIVDRGFVTLKVYDVLGREVRTLVSKIGPPGSYAVTLDASRLPSGVYLYRLQAGSYRAVKKPMLLK